MTVETMGTIQRYVGNGATIDWDFPWFVRQAVDIKFYVKFTGSTIYTEIISNLSITLLPSGGARVRYPVSGSALISTDIVLIERLVSYTQPAYLSNQTRYYPNVIEGGLDNLETQIQQLAYLYGQTLRLGNFDEAAPLGEDRAGRLLGFDASGNVALASDITLGAEIKTTEYFTTTAPNTTCILASTPISNAAVELWVEEDFQEGWTRSGDTIVLLGTPAGLSVRVTYYYKYPLLGISEANRITYTVAGGPERTLQQFIEYNPSIDDYGADITALDNAPAINAMLAVTGRIHVPAGKRYILKSALLRTGDLEITGGGTLVWAADATSTGISVVLTTANNYSDSVNIGGIHLHTQKSGSGIALHIDGSAQVSGGVLQKRTFNRVTLRGTQFRGDRAPGVDGWLEHCVLTAVSNIEASDTYMSGYINPSEENIISATGFRFDDVGNGAVANFTRVSVYYCKRGIDYDGVEGVTLVQCNLVAVNYGVYAINSNVGYAPWLSVGDTHINARVRGIQADSIQGVMVHDNFIWQRQSSTSDGAAVQLTDCDDITITNNQFVGDYVNTGGLNYYGVLLGTGVTDAVVRGNQGQDVTYLAWAQSDADNVLLEGNTVSKEAVSAPAPILYLNTSSGRVVIDTEKFSGKNAGIITAASGTLVDVDMGTVHPGQKFLVSANVTYTKGGVDGDTHTVVLDGGGTATVVFTHDDNELRHRAPQATATVAVHMVTGFMTVTVGGTLTLRSQFTSAGSDATIAAGAAQLAAVQLGNSIQLS